MKKVELARPALTEIPRMYRDDNVCEIAVAHPRYAESDTDLFYYTFSAYTRRTMVRSRYRIPKWVSIEKIDGEDRGFWSYVETDIWHDDHSKPEMKFKDGPGILMERNVDELQKLLKFADEQGGTPSVTRDGPCTDSQMMARRFGAKIRAAIARLRS